MIEDTIERLSKRVKGNGFEPYIRHIRFPQYKNLAPFTNIEFNFPVTALVGENGTNKSSILKALYGAPGYKNLGALWFSTSIDPIEEGDSFPNCFIYGYKNQYRNEIVEVLKTRIHKDKDPDYWEPSRPLDTYNMADFPPSKPVKGDVNQQATRWKSIRKNVVLIDFRHIISAFDRFFYDGDFPEPSILKIKKHKIRIESKPLNEVFSSNLKSFVRRRIDRIVPSKTLSLNRTEVSKISYILNREYSSIKLAFHTFFKNKGYTAKLHTKSNIGYSEAFAGSGEFAIVMLVHQIHRSPKKSLILLDEPEVSLHPGAQERLIEYLLEEALKKNHQVVFTTHSPSLIAHLPPDAIKVLQYNNLTSLVELRSQYSTPLEAFTMIGYSITDRKRIIVEDVLAKALVNRALEIHGPEYLKIFEIDCLPGGCSALYKHTFSQFTLSNLKKTFVLLDGDQRPANDWPSEAEIERLTLDELEEEYNKRTKCEPHVVFDGGNDKNVKTNEKNARKNLLIWVKKFVHYLPENTCPETIIYEKVYGKLKIGSDAKTEFKNKAIESVSPIDGQPLRSEEIFFVQRQALAKIDKSDKIFKDIFDTVKSFV